MTTIRVKGGDTEQIAVDAATQLYARQCHDRGAIFQQPGHTEVNGDVVTLDNVNGTLAKYRFAIGDREYDDGWDVELTAV